MRTTIIYGIMALLLIWGCSKDENGEDLTPGEPTFSFQVVGEGGNKTLSGNDIVFNSTITDAKDLDGTTPIEINSVTIVAQVPQGGKMASVLISITDRGWVEAGTHSLGTDILDNYNAVVTYWVDTSAGITMIAHDGFIKLDTRTNSKISGSISASGGESSIKGTFTAPSMN